MTRLPSESRAHGAPGIDPRWTRATKEAVGTAYHTASRVWFTVSTGILNEVYYPTIDRPQIRDLQFLVTDGETFFHDERRHLDHRVEWLDAHSLGVRVTSVEREGRYRFLKEVVADPHLPCVLLRTRLEADPELRGRLRIFVLLAPHLEGGGRGNTGQTARVGGRELLVAHRDDRWLALAATLPFRRTSCGYVGTSDGWTDLAEDRRMDWTYDLAEDGNVALTGELDLKADTADAGPDPVAEFTVALAFGEGFHAAATTVLQSLAFPYSEHRERFTLQWSRACDELPELEPEAGDGGLLYHTSGARGAARIRPLPHGAGGGGIPGETGTRDAAGAMGGGGRILTVHPGSQHRGPHVRGVPGTRSR